MFSCESCKVSKNTFLTEQLWATTFVCNNGTIDKGINVRHFLIRSILNPCQANVPIMEKPGSWFLLAKCVKKHLRKSDILSKDAGHRPASLPKMSLFRRCFSFILLLKTN